MVRGLDGYFDLPVVAASCAVFKLRRGPCSVSPFFGGDSEGATPLPIPNRAVKPLSADGTWLARAWESRSPPILTWAAPGAARFLLLLPRLPRRMSDPRNRPDRAGAVVLVPALHRRPARGARPRPPLGGHFEAHVARPTPALEQARPRTRAGTASDGGTPPARHGRVAARLDLRRPAAGTRGRPPRHRGGSRALRGDRRRRARRGSSSRARATAGLPSASTSGRPRAGDREAELLVTGGARPPVSPAGPRGWRPAQCRPLRPRRCGGPQPARRGSPAPPSCGTRSERGRGR